jgi:cystathionine beta-lyase
MNFDEMIERRNTHSGKWDMMEKFYGVSPSDGISMWVADMDFRPPQCINDALQARVDHGVHGYFGDDRDYKAAINWWMTEPGDAILMFSPIYYVFYRIIEQAGRTVTESPLINNNGRYEMDLEDAAKRLTGKEKMVVISSPHNPGGRCWSAEELRALGAFCKEHDLILVSDEIHCDLVYPGQKHVPAISVLPDMTDRLVMLTAPTKTFNIAAAHNGNIILPDATKRTEMERAMMGLGLSPNPFGLHMETAAYSPEGAAWVDALMTYLAGNRKLLDDGVHAIPGLKSMALEATYLSWVDFTDTGMDMEEVRKRIEKDARIAASHGHTFGGGGEAFMRFNIATPRARVAEAVARLQSAFSDLQ